MPRKKIEVTQVPYGTGTPGKELVHVKAKGTSTRKPYVTNKELLAEFAICKEKGELSNLMAKYLMQIATKYSYHPWFGGYSYREDMVCEAVVQLCRVWHKFNPEKSSNYFAWATTCVYRSFLAYLERERTERKIIEKMLGDAGLYSYNAQADSSKNSDETAFTTVKTE